MVLAKRTEAGLGGFLLHDAESGAEYPLGDSSIKLVHACGGVVLYAKRLESGQEAACTARICMQPEKKKGK